MTDEERDVIRTKLMLLETDVLYVPHSSSGKKWAVIKLGASYFRFRREYLRVFYSTEDQALEAALKHMLAGEELTVMVEFHGD